MPIRPASYWQETVDLSPPRPSLEGTVEANVTTIGGGYCGLSTALYLKRARPDLRVVLLERAVCGWGASGRNGGFAMTLFGLTVELVKLRFGAASIREPQPVMAAAVPHPRPLA